MRRSPLMLLALVACSDEPCRYDCARNLEKAIAEQPALSTYRALAEAAGSSPIFSTRQATLTVLAPVNTAFEDIDVDVLQADKTALLELVRFHILGGVADVETVRFGEEIDFRTITSTTIRTTRSRDGIGFHDAHGNTARLISSYVYTENGMLYLIDGVLRPPPKD